MEKIGNQIDRKRRMHKLCTNSNAAKMLKKVSKRAIGMLCLDPLYEPTVFSILQTLQGASDQGDHTGKCAEWF